jgi:hypothetical protein
MMNNMKTKGYAAGGKIKMKTKGYAAGGKIKMVMKDGKKVPDFAADGVGKMAKGGKISADMVSPRKAMAMGMTPSGAKKTAKKTAKKGAK